MGIMKRKIFAILMIFSVATSVLCLGGLGTLATASVILKESTAAATHTSSPIAPSTDGRYSDAELDELLAPIALYPDPLLAQVIPAATFIDQIVEASRVLGGKVDESLIDKQNWDVSVKAVAHYPEVIDKMTQKQDWTIAIGQAYVNQPADVMASLQRLRVAAKNSGALVSTPQQTVVVEKDVIKIDPAESQVIYVPQYNPEVVYASSTGAVVGSSLLAFGTGMAIGAWLNRDWNWGGGGIYYHGWSGAGWVGRSRGYVNVNNNFYVNNNFRNVGVNRAVVNRDISGYRRDVNTRATSNNGLNINRNTSGYNANTRANNNRTTGAANRTNASTNRATGTANRTNASTNRTTGAANRTNASTNRATGASTRTVGSTNHATGNANRTAGSANHAAGNANRTAGSANHTPTKTATGHKAGSNTPHSSTTNRSATTNKSASPKPAAKSGGAKSHSKPSGGGKSGGRR